MADKCSMSLAKLRYTPIITLSYVLRCFPVAPKASTMAGEDSSADGGPVPGPPPTASTKTGCKQSSRLPCWTTVLAPASPSDNLNSQIPGFGHLLGRPQMLRPCTKNPDTIKLRQNSTDSIWTLKILLVSSKSCEL